MSDEDDAALDQKLRAVLGSGQSTDAQVLNALDKGLWLGSKKIARSLEAIDKSKTALADADKAMEARPVR